MAATKECPSCGAPNDTILTNCVYCHSNLPVNEDAIKSISNEDLLIYCAEWIGKFEGLTSDRSRLISEKQISRMKGFFLGSLMQLGVKKEDRVINYSTYLEAINKYLTILQIRAISNDIIRPVYEDLKRRFIEAKAKGDKVMGYGAFQEFFSPMFGAVNKKK